LKSQKAKANNRNNKEGLSLTVPKKMEKGGREPLAMSGSTIQPGNVVQNVGEKENANCSVQVENQVEGHPYSLETQHLHHTNVNQSAEQSAEQSAKQSAKQPRQVHLSQNTLCMQQQPQIQPCQLPRGQFQSHQPNIPQQMVQMQRQQSQIHPPFYFGGSQAQSTDPHLPQFGPKMQGLNVQAEGQVLVPPPPSLGDLSVPPPPPPTVPPTVATNKHLAELCNTFHGSRYIQNQLELDPVLADGTYSFFNLFFGQIKDRVYEVMTNKFGRFAFEKVVDRCNDAQRTILLQNLLPSLAKTACDPHGSFGTQLLIKSLCKTEHIKMVVEALKSDVLNLITDYKGHYLVIVLISQFAPENTTFIDEVIVSNCSLVSINNQGLQVMKSLFKNRTVEQLLPVMHAISGVTMHLVENQYGNYVLQLVLSKNCDGSKHVLKTIRDYRVQIVKMMQGSYRHLAQQKASSNVVEACLKQPDCRSYFNIIINELLAPPQAAVRGLVNDSFGNYVLQTVLLVADSKQVAMIKERIIPHFHSFRVNIREKWIKLIKVAEGRTKGIGHIAR